MDPYLISLRIRRRVAAETNAIVRLQVQLRDKLATAIVLGRKGSMHEVFTEDRFSHDQLMAAAKEGLLYAEEQQAVWAFAAGLDTDTGLPVLMEPCKEAFRRRQLDNGQHGEQKQLALKPAENPTIQ